MSFLETIRGFGRSSKKNKKDDPSDLYAHPNSPGYTSIKQKSPTRLSPSRRKNQGRHLSPTRDQNRRLQHALQYLPTHSIKNQPYNSLPSTDPLSHDQPPLPVATSENLPLFMCEPFIQTALVKGSFKTIVQLPKYVDCGEWLALNIFELFNNLNQFYGVISDYVTLEKFPTMNAGPDTDYMWVNGNGQPINLPAAQYIDYVLTWISSKLNNQAVFPTTTGGAFPPTFLKDCKNISRQMFRIFAHIYHNHFETIVHLSLEPHWNSFFAHFISLVKSFELIDRNEMTPLLPLIEDLERQNKII